MAIIKINLSGHDNQALTDQGFIFPGALHCNLSDPDVAQKVATWVADIGISSGDTVTIAAPGLAPLALMVAATIHGLTGTFPFIQPLVRDTDGAFVPGPVIDLQGLRNDVVRKLHRQDIVEL
jgi:hypothetical protein